MIVFATAVFIGYCNILTPWLGIYQPLYTFFVCIHVGSNDEAQQVGDTALKRSNIRDTGPEPCA